MRMQEDRTPPTAGCVFERRHPTCGRDAKLIVIAHLVGVVGHPQDAVDRQDQAILALYDAGEEHGGGLAVVCQAVDDLLPVRLSERERDRGHAATGTAASRFVRMNRT